MAQTYLTPPPTIRRHTASDSEETVTRSPVLKSIEHKSNRNTKTWSLDEERILLQGRLERTPYKQIGARLGKTDLACRLHFHQMVMAKRTPQTQPGRRIVFLSSEHPPEIHHLAPSLASIPSTVDRRYLLNRERLSRKQKGVMTMKQLQGLERHHRSTSYPCTESQHRSSLSSWQPAASPYTWLGSNDRFASRDSPTPLDIDRLNYIYQEHADDFWSTIAAKYSGSESLDPSELEYAFFNAQDSPFDMPPTIVHEELGQPQDQFMSREASPNLQLPGIRHVRSGSELSNIAGRCSVDSLLNHGLQ